MRRMIYASTSSHALTSSELDAIASKAHGQNAAEGLTGMLLYGDHSFFQVLEGPDEKIEDMKKRIWDDPRHRGISEFQDIPIEAPVFSDWSMGCYRIDGVPSSSAIWTIDNFDTISQHLPTETPADMHVLVHTFFSSISPRGALVDEL